MAEVKQITAAQRAQNFAAATRQNLHMVPSKTLTNFGESVQFNYPKARLLGKTFVKFDVKLSGATGLEFKNVLKPYEIIRRISLSLNNGFEPFVISGRDLAILNMVRMTEMKNLAPKAVGADGEYSFMIELENTLNQRDASSLILLQNESTQVTLSVDLATNLKGIVETENDIELVSCKITPMLQTWTIPNYTDAFPDLSVIKLAKSRTESILSAGEHVVKLDVGTIYRKLIFYVTDAEGNGVDLDTNIELIYNTADTPVSIDAKMLRFKNTSDFGFEFPKGVYVFDFSGYSGFSGYGGSRDFIDTERLSEFWVRLTTDAECKITTIQENLSRLR